MRCRTVTVALAIGRPSSSRSVATWRNDLPKPTVRRVTPDSRIRARSDALVPLLGRPPSEISAAVDGVDVLVLLVVFEVLDTLEVVFEDELDVFEEAPEPASEVSSPPLQPPSAAST